MAVGAELQVLGVVRRARRDGALGRALPQGALVLVERVVAEGGRALGGQQRVADQGDVDGGRVELEQGGGPAVVLAVLGDELLDAVQHAGHVQPGPHQERQQLSEVVDSGADPGREQGDARIEHRQQQQGGDREQPVPGQRIAWHHQDDHDEHAHREQHLLQFDHHVGERQRGARELQRPDQRQAVGDHLGRGDERPLGETEHENAGDEEGQVRRNAPAHSGNNHAEDQEVHAGVEQRRENLPELAQLRLGVHGDVASGGEAHDEAPPAR